MPRPVRLNDDFYRRDARVVARDLLGRTLMTAIGGITTGGRIIETEAYLGVGDAASHSHRGPSARNAAMFLAGGHAYVYLIYGMYWCFNVVSGDEGDGQAVLVRAIEPMTGVEEMRRRRGDSAKQKDLTNGPGKLAIALGIGPELNGADLTTDKRIWIEPGEDADGASIRTTPRIGITKDAHHEWRYLLDAAPDQRTRSTRRISGTR